MEIGLIFPHIIPCETARSLPAAAVDPAVPGREIAEDSLMNEQQHHSGTAASRPKAAVQLLIDALCQRLCLVKQIRKGPAGFCGKVLLPPLPEAGCQ